ncbi:pyridoxal phosphate-dependent decarboxylase family protein [Amycolatopsis suaedae]|uniref:Aminotransferase class V-fold PLP-dependent enzyme n=1 Tax=Amycolatopsis suaedae TaxID=2510978 RepID=A0A4V2ELR3_9PSEU|nr:aminotransferase class V-fold PLP-dependent enzyme [Amycolatopsis suaedae]RZQ62465.1 aminotransferase class V-fold PLP-dependent enzyme [Amycolatopsis suaedae]
MLPLESSPAELRSLGSAVLDAAVDFLESLGARPAHDPRSFTQDVAITGEAQPLAEVLATALRAAESGVETAGPRYLGYIPAGGLVSSAVAALLTQVLNRYATVADLAPGLVAIEQSVLDWLTTEFALPSTAGGLLTTGGSAATLSAVVAAREHHLGDESRGATLYVSGHTHLCVAKAARVAGLPRDCVRVVPVDDRLRMDPDAAARMIAADRRAGRQPFLLAGTAGTTDTGAVDPLTDLAALARRENLWFHVDGAYGGAFQLTERGRERLAGVELADSIVLDPHKGLFLPYGLGTLLVRDTATLVAAHRHDAPYLQDLGDGTGLPDYADHGVELTREHRGLRLWLPLRLHGVQAFRDALDEKLDLAEHTYRELGAMPGIDVPWHPSLSTVAFRCAAGDTATRAVFDAIRRDGRVFLTSTTIGGRFHIRLCVLSHRTHAEHVDEALAAVRAACSSTAAMTRSPRRLPTP